eukprot:TRINITY_DN14163_c0_g1_i6.p1 TRINITY_DN14163_c0_g1~~TRINITY_DN14163_c0_g1_i6.p1  ORF type:complete len:302 (+),score=65.81 TRINITY_DN14163_c0_g1_i6:170-1075(+)
MQTLDGKDSEDLTTEGFNCDDQLFASRQNKFSQFSNPSLHSKALRKSSIQSLALYNTRKKILSLARRMPSSAGFEEQIEWTVRTAIETGRITARKLKTAVAAATYMVSRASRSCILLSQIAKTYNVKYGEISKYLAIFKMIGLYKEFDALSLWQVYVRLVDCWFPYGNDIIKTTDSTFSLDPAKLAVGFTVVKESEESKERGEGINIRERLLKTGKAIIDLPEIDLAKQGKLPQTFAAGIFIVGAKICSLKIPRKEVAGKLDISLSTVSQSKKEVLEILSNKLGSNWQQIGNFANSSIAKD